MTAAPRYRFYVVVAVLILLTCVVAGRITYLKLIDAAFLGDQGDRRSVRHIPIPVTRGMITDRNGAPLAVSTEVVTIWCNPAEMQDSADQLGRLAQAIHKPEAELRNLILGLRKALPLPGPGAVAHRRREHHGPRRARGPPDQGIQALLPQLRPGGPGDRHGQHRRPWPGGAELGFEDWLAGKGGVREVLINPRGSVVKNIRVVRQPRPSKDVALSIDLRLQFIAYRALQTAVEKFGAQSGSAVLVNPKTGQILAMTNFPSYNPNNRATLQIPNMRNRTLTDAFEPGSVIKPFSMSVALASGKFNENSTVDVAPGWMTIDVIPSTTWPSAAC